jgi:hypothetical protein
MSYGRRWFERLHRVPSEVAELTLEDALAVNRYFDAKEAKGETV